MARKGRSLLVLSPEGPLISPSNNAANYCRFRAGGADIMILSLPYEPGKQELEWAAGVAARYPRDQIILATHSSRGRRGLTPQGKVIWDDLVNQTPNIFMVVSGHVPAVAHAARTKENGASVQEILCDYQGLPDGGSGWLQELRFDPLSRKISIRAYSPLLDEYNLDPQHTYELDWAANVQH